jgi:hypothetical protein
LKILREYNSFVIDLSRYRLFPVSHAALWNFEGSSDDSEGEVKDPIEEKSK